MSGAKFFKCALQVNPYQYTKDFKGGATFSSESDYNKKMVEALSASGIEVIAITNHFSVGGLDSLRIEAERNGIHVFPGFEAKSSEGVHFLCLFERGESSKNIEFHINKLVDPTDNNESPLSDRTAIDLLDYCYRNDIICIAAHILSETGGLLKTLKGQSRVKAWKTPNLLAGAISLLPEDTDKGNKDILLNRNKDFQRNNPIAILNATDVSTPSSCSSEGMSCHIKMSNVSLEGLRQSFLDPEGRIILSSDKIKTDKLYLQKLVITGVGFYKNLSIDLNENLNVLIGGRGSGKSTILEAIRYAFNLESSDSDINKTSKNIIKKVLGAGCKIEIHVRSKDIGGKVYIVERQVSADPVVRDASTGDILEDINPQHLCKGIEVLGQHEISSIAKSPERLTRILTKFVETDEDKDREVKLLKEQLEENRHELVKQHRFFEDEFTNIESDLALYEEQHALLQKLKIPEEIKELDSVKKSHTFAETVTERVQSDFIDVQKAIKELQIPTRTSLEYNASDYDHAQGKLDTIMSNLDKYKISIEEKAKELNSEIGAIIKSVQESSKTIAEASLKKEEEISLKIAGTEGLEDMGGYNAVVHISEKLSQCREQAKSKKIAEAKIKSLTKKRRQLLDLYRNQLRELFLSYHKASKELGREIPDQLSIQVEYEGNKNPLKELLESVNGITKAFFEKVNNPELEFNILDFCNSCLEKNKEELKQKYNLTSGHIDALTSEENKELIYKAQELEFPVLTKIRLNIAPVNTPPKWKDLDDLSTGQKATALLLMLFQESGAPLIIDQPEDDLDNFFISEVVVGSLRKQKQFRQLIFSSHNANIPVLGDAELIIGLNATHEESKIIEGCCGSIDNPRVAEVIKKILEGGKDAFEKRREKYGFKKKEA